MLYRHWSVYYVRWHNLCCSACYQLNCNWWYYNNYKRHHYEHSDIELHIPRDYLFHNCNEQYKLSTRSDDIMHDYRRALDYVC